MTHPVVLPVERAAIRGDLVETILRRHFIVRKAGLPVSGERIQTTVGWPRTGDAAEQGVRHVVGIGGAEQGGGSVRGYRKAEPEVVLDRGLAPVVKSPPVTGCPLKSVKMPL